MDSQWSAHTNVPDATTGPCNLQLQQGRWQPATGDRSYSASGRGWMNVGGDGWMDVCIGGWMNRWISCCSSKFERWGARGVTRCRVQSWTVLVEYRVRVWVCERVFADKSTWEKGVQAVPGLYGVAG